MTKAAALPETIAGLSAIVGGLSAPSKMPGPAYSTSAFACITGEKLAQVEGSTCKGCYARKGRYGFQNVQDALARRLESLSDPRWTAAMIALVGRKARAAGVFRWHDSGDLQGVEHLRAICDVAAGTPEIRHWLPTREYQMVSDYLTAGGVIPTNLTVRLSAHMDDGPPPFKLAARHEQLTVSTVSTTEDRPAGAYICPAPTQDNQCGACRACWDSTTAHVDYHRH